MIKIIIIYLCHSLTLKPFQSESVAIIIFTMKCLVCASLSVYFLGVGVVVTSQTCYHGDKVLPVAVGSRPSWAPW